MRSDDDLTDIREIQHYAYCPHRWGLIYLACDWSENVFVNKANLIHARVEGGKSSVLPGKLIERSVKIYNDVWGLFGVLDCLELIPDEAGCYLPRYGNKFRFAIVEYKPTTPSRMEATDADKMQLLAQKICVDAMFDTKSEAYFYYADVRRRQQIFFSDEDFARLRQILQAIRQCYAKAELPPVRKKQYCSGCSMKDICLPKTRDTLCEKC